MRPSLTAKAAGGKIGFVQDQVADAARRVAPAAREVGGSEIAGLVHALRPLFARRMAGGKTHSASGKRKCALPKSGLPALQF